MPKPTIGQTASPASSVAETSLRGLRPHWTYKRALRPFRGARDSTWRDVTTALCLIAGARRGSEGALWLPACPGAARSLQSAHEATQGPQRVPSVRGSPCGGLEAEPPSPAPTWAGSRVETEAATERRDCVRAARERHRRSRHSPPLKRLGLIELGNVDGSAAEQSLSACS